MTPVRRGYSAVPPCDQRNGVPKIDSVFNILAYIGSISQFQDASPKQIHHFWRLTSRSSFSSCWNDRAWDETNQHILGGWDDNPMFFFLKTWLGTANSPTWILIMFPMKHHETSAIARYTPILNTSLSWTRQHQPEFASPAPNEVHIALQKPHLEVRFMFTPKNDAGKAP